MSNRVLIACGGTGGHLFPGIAVAEELQRRGHQTMLLVSRKTIDHQALFGRGDLSSAAMPSMGWPGMFSLKLPKFLVELWKGQQACGKIFQDFRPNVVLGMGGFISAVPLWMGRRRRLPILLHESNVIPGKVTRMMSRTAERVLLGFGKCAEYLSRATCVVTGTPVRDGLRRIDQAQARQELGLSMGHRTILVMGGSQGAGGINNILVSSLPHWGGLQENWQFIHLTGEADLQRVDQAYQSTGFRAKVSPFSQQMELLYSAADVVVSRSGAASLTEIGHYGLPSVLIPFPQAADDHQLANAQEFERAGASLVWEQSSLQPETFSEAFRAWVQNDRMLLDMSEAARKLTIENAAGCVAHEVEQCARS